MICRPSMDNKWTSKHSIHVAIGYLLPACITTLALIMEFALDECNPWKPRFGEGSCFFAHKKSKWLWLFGPITVMLALNVIGCIMIVTKIWRQNRKRDKLGLQSRNQQTSKMDNTLRSIPQVGAVLQDSHRHGRHLDVRDTLSNRGGKGTLLVLHGRAEHAAGGLHLLVVRLHEEGVHGRLWEAEDR